MLAKRFRVNNRKLLLNYYRHSKIIQTRYFKIYKSTPRIDHFMVAVLAYKKYFKTSVRRNYLRRVGYSILREQISLAEFKEIINHPYLLVVVVKPEIEDKSYQEIKKDLLTGLIKLR